MTKTSECSIDVAEITQSLSYSVARVRCDADLESAIQDHFGFDGELISIVVWNEEEVLRVRANWFSKPVSCFDPVYITNTKFLSIEKNKDGYVISDNSRSNEASSIKGL